MAQSVGRVGRLGRMGSVGKREPIYLHGSAERSAATTQPNARQCKALGSDNADQRTDLLPILPTLPITTHSTHKPHDLNSAVNG